VLPSWTRSRVTCAALVGGPTGGSTRRGALEIVWARERDPVRVGCCWHRVHAQQRREGRNAPVRFMPRRDATGEVV
jgi:hypothetical protein